MGYFIIEGAVLKQQIQNRGGRFFANKGEGGYLLYYSGFDQNFWMTK